MARSRPGRVATAPSSAAAGRREPPLDLVSWAVGVAFLAAYAALLSPVAGDKDSGEFVLVLATGGVAHPTGYPLYTILGLPFVHAAHALGASWAQAANLWSALAGAAAMAGLHAVAARLLVPACGARRAAGLAALPVLAFGLNPMWTLEATLAEVNAMHVLWVVLAALVARRALAAFSTAGARPGRLRAHAAAWGLVVGAGLAHHATSVLFALPLTVVLAGALFGQAGRGRGAALAAGIGAALVPLASYAWVAWHAWHPVPGQWAELAPSWRSVLEHVTGGQYRRYLGHYAPALEQRRFLASYVYPWLVPAGLGALAAAFRPVPADRAWRVGLALGVLAQIAYAFSYGVRDPSSYFLPALAIGLALGVDLLARLRLVRQHAAVAALVLAALLVVPIAEGVRAARARNRAYVALADLIGRMWAGVPPGPALVVWDDDMASRLRGFQLLEGSRPDVEVVQPRRLLNEAPRRRFLAAHGFDPAGAVTGADREAASRDEARAEAVVDTIVATINARSPEPVLLFLPRVPSLRLLRKPGAAPPDAAPSAAGD